MDSVTAQLVAWQGLRAVQRTWAATGHATLAARAGRIADRLEKAMRPAVRRALVKMPDGSLFLPYSLTNSSRPYQQLSATRMGSYWNLVVPYALASGFFAPGSAESRGLLTYLLLHGSRLLGIPRADAHIVYRGAGAGKAFGLGEIYGLSSSRFFADNDEADQLVLSLYGMLAGGMTQDTYVSGEAISVLPIGNTYYRKMYMPPNSGANAAFLETLRLLLVHERRGADSAPTGLDLAFATPRDWLADGKQIVVDRAPTSFGLLSYSDRPPGAVDRGAHRRAGERSLPAVAAPPAGRRHAHRRPGRRDAGAVRAGRDDRPQRPWRDDRPPGDGRRAGTAADAVVRRSPGPILGPVPRPPQRSRFPSASPASRRRRAGHARGAPRGRRRSSSASRRSRASARPCGAASRSSACARSATCSRTGRAATSGRSRSARSETCSARRRP